MSFLRRLLSPPVKPKPRALEAGMRAPDFDLPSTIGGSVRLSDHRGVPVVLAFYPADSTPVCGSQMALYNEILPMFEEHDARLLGISLDGLESHREFARALGLRFPLLSDADPSGSVAASYGVLRPGEGVSERALFVIDREGIVAWSEVFPPGTNPGADGILQALESLHADTRGRP